MGRHAMLTSLVRHARTAYSANYRVNGRPDVGVPLDSTGQDQCLAARPKMVLENVAACVVSEFRRTAQTAELLLGGRSVPMTTDRRLNELDYGDFEGGPLLEYGRWLRVHGPWQRPLSELERGDVSAPSACVPSRICRHCARSGRPTIAAARAEAWGSCLDGTGGPCLSADVRDGRVWSIFVRKYRPSY
jgi:hypothetical protein